MSKIIYLCIPYSWHPERSFKIANRVASELMLKGNIVFSPISHSHPISEYMHDRLQTDHDFWMKQDSELLKRCNEVIVVIIGESGMELIKNSKGCQSELRIAEENNIPVKYLKYYDLKYYE